MADIGKTANLNICVKLSIPINKKVIYGDNKAIEVKIDIDTAQVAKFVDELTALCLRNGYSTEVNIDIEKAGITEAEK